MHGPADRHAQTMRHRRWIIGLIVWVAVCVLGVAPCWAIRVRSINLEEMTQKAGRIVAGRCVAVEVIHDSSLDVVVTRVTVSVERAVKGVKGADGSTVVFRMLGDATSSSGTGIVGLPRFAVGEKVVLFLYPESRSGLTSPVGLDQGKFVEVLDKQGRALAMNGFPNRRLFKGMSSTAKARLKGVDDSWIDRPGLPPDLLIRMVESLQP
jgi:hypothetical protein